MSNQPYPVVGLRNGLGPDGVNGQVPFRREIRDLQRNFPDQFNIFMLGLLKLQDTNYLPQTNKLSWYGVSGIHGLPYIPWDGVNSTESGNAATSVGYCSHSSPVFPTWHRGYLAAYEQTVYAAIQEAIKGFTDQAQRTRFTQAAVNFRIPYWDWAINDGLNPNDNTLPDVVAGRNRNSNTWNAKTITLETPTGRQAVRNPLVSYPFKPVPTNVFNSRFGQYPETVRNPGRTSNSNNAQIATILNNNAEGLREGLYTLILEYDNYLDFSNNEFRSNNPEHEMNPLGYNSVEGIHNQIHVLVGRGGHMNVPDYAAFDPIFWLHHCMVDRVFALWQALHPNSYFETTQVDPTRGLLPFHKDTAGKFCTSDSVRALKTFGYTYPELVDWGVEASTIHDRVEADVRRLYVDSGNTRAAPLGKIGGQVDGPGGQEVLSENTGSGDPASATTYPYDPFRRWIVNIKVEKYALHGSFVVYVFVGDVDDADPDGWCVEPHLAGTYATFANDPRATSCEKCVGDYDRSIIVTGAVPIWRALNALVTSGDLPNLEPDTVVPYLRKNLHWRVALADGEPIDRNAPELQSLKVSVVSTVVDPPQQGDILPVPGPPTIHYDITDGRPAGLGTE